MWVRLAKIRRSRKVLREERQSRVCTPCGEAAGLLMANTRSLKMVGIHRRSLLGQKSGQAEAFPPAGPGKAAPLGMLGDLTQASWNSLIRFLVS